MKRITSGLLKRSAVIAFSILSLVLAAPFAALAADPVGSVCSDGSEGFAAAEAGSAAAAPYAGTGKLTAEMVAGQDALALSYDEIKALPAAVGKVGVESVIGGDTRVRTYTTTYPARATALITFTGGWCTGFFISPNTIATAGHCVNVGGTGGTLGAWRTSVRVYPGYNAGSAPYGSYLATKLFTTTTWARYSNENYDYGAIKIATPIGNTVGWYGRTTANGPGLPAVTIGYPGDKTPAKSQWMSADRIWTSTTTQLFYKNDTAGGMSGSAVWYDLNLPYAIAIHAYGVHGAVPHSTYNHGVRITTAVNSLLSSWIAAAP